MKKNKIQSKKKKKKHTPKTSLHKDGHMFHSFIIHYFIIYSLLFPYIKS